MTTLRTVLAVNTRLHTYNITLYVLFKMRLRYLKGWILLDSKSTVDLFLNEILLTDIHDAKGGLVLFCNASKAIFTKKAILRGMALSGFIRKVLC